MSELALRLIAENKKTKDPYLDLGNCGLTELPMEVVDCVWLETLVLSDSWNEYNLETGDLDFRESQNEDAPNNLSRLPKEIYCLSQIRKLVVENIRSFFDLSSVSALQNLQSLACNNTQVSNLEPLQNLQNLQSLDCSHTQVSNLEPLQNLQNLQSLDCSHTQVSNLEPLQNLQNLQSLNCSSTQVSNLEPLQNLQNLQSLNCHRTQVSNLEPLQNLQNLQQLGCFGTQVSNLESLQNLQNLQSLVCSATQVFNLEPLQNLQNLQSLNCSSTQVSNLESLQNLQNLQSLNCSSTQVSNLEPLQNLQNLQLLFCLGTQVSNLEPLQNLKNLELLFCTGTQVSNLEPLQNLQNLQSLNCSYTQVSNLEPLQNLKNLQSLACSGTQVSNLEPLQNLQNLQSLACDNTQVQNISLDWLNRLSNLSDLNLSGCLLAGIPKEILGEELSHNCLTDLKNYLRDKQEKGETRNNEVKVLLIGNGGVGKTQIAGRLVEREHFIFNRQHDPTHAIVLLRRRLEVGAWLPDGLQLQLWDFAGQDLYHATHRLFMQTRALFLLVWDNKSEGDPYHVWNGERYKNEKLAYWLAYAQCFGQDSPVLVLQNKIDDPDLKEFMPRPAQNHLKESFGQIADFIPLSAASGECFNVLERAIGDTFENNPVLRRELLDVVLPRPWVVVREAIRALQSAEHGPRKLDWPDFVHLCDRAEVPDSAASIAAFLHNTGVLYYRPGYFGNALILDQAWAIEAVYEVLNRKKKYASHLAHQRGRLSYRDLVEIWKENSDGEREIFIDFMLSAELCFETTVDKKSNTPLWDRSFVVPQLLPIGTPEYVEEYAAAAGLNATHSLPFAFLPPVFIQRFIIKAQYFSAVEDMWQSGILVRHGATAALVEADYDRKEIRIRYTPNAGELLDAIRGAFEHIADEGRLKARPRQDGSFDPLEFWEKRITNRNYSNTMKEKIRQLIQQGRTREALELLVGSVPEANVNLSKLSNMERRSRAGAMDFDEYSKNLSEINLNILDMLDQLPDTPQPAVQPIMQAAPTPPPPAPVAASTPAPAPAPAAAPVAGGFRTLRLFLASSAELRADRDAFELYFRQLNDDLPQEKGVYLKIVRWENFLDAMSETRLQDEYNQAIRSCDIFLSLFFTKTGKYTEEEFDAAHQQFQSAGKPLIFTFFKNASLNTGEISNDILTLLNFKKKLGDLGHFYTGYDNIEHLKRQFRDQLDKMLREGKI